MRGVTCMRLTDVSVICHVTYFQFPVQVCFSSMSVRQAAPVSRTAANWFMQYQTSNVADSLDCTRCTAQGNDFKLILSIKMETTHPEEGYFGTEFWAMCNHRGVTAA